MVFNMPTWMSFADGLRREEKTGVLLQLGRRVPVRVSIHVMSGLRHFPSFRGGS